MGLYFEKEAEQEVCGQRKGKRTMKKIALIVVSVIAVLAVLVIGGFYMLFRHGDPLKHAPDEAIVGVNAPNTSIYKLSGEKPLFLNIWATWCPPCVGEMPAIEKMYKKYGDRMHFAAISVDSDPAVVPDFVSGKGFTFPIYTGDADKLSKDYSIDVTRAPFSSAPTEPSSRITSAP